MAKRGLYTQCLLIQHNPLGITMYTAFIPKEFAVQGKCIKIDGKQGEWIVKEIFPTSSITSQQGIEQVLDHRRFKEQLDK